MFDQLRKNWDQFLNSKPGQRFRERYYRRSERKAESTLLKKILIVITGTIIILTGVVLWFIPGPGWLTIFLGAALIAGEFLLVAKFLDFTELKIRIFIA